MAFDAILWAKLKGCATLVGGKVPSEQLPSYVDEVIEVTSYSDLPQPGEAGKIYYTLDTEDSYRWGSTKYILVSSGNTEALAKLTDLDALAADVETTYAKKEALEGLATENFVREQISSIPEVDLSGFYTATQTDEKIEAAIASIEIPEIDLTSYATEQFVKDEIAKIEIPNPDLSEYAKKSELPTVISAFTNDSGYITSAALSGYATRDFVVDEIAKIDVKDLDLSEYAKSSEIPKAVSQLENDLGFINSQALEGFVDAEYVSNEISSATVGLATADQLAAKADDIPFTSDMIVGNALGGFSQGENVKNMTFKAIIEKLLKLSAPTTDSEITVDNIKSSYISQDGGNTFIEFNTKDSAIIRDDTIASKDLSGIFEDADGNVGYQIQTAAIDTEDDIAKVYIDPSYEISEIQVWVDPEWMACDDEIWKWEESPVLENIMIDNVSTPMRVYIYNFEYTGGEGSSEYRFIVKNINN